MATPRAPAVFGLSSAALSQVSLVTGSGTSWSQPLLANRPSSTRASRSKTSSRFPAESGPAGFAAATAPAIGSARSAGVTGGTVEPLSIPSCRNSRQAGFERRPVDPGWPSGRRVGRSRRARTSRTRRAGRGPRAPPARRRAARSSAGPARACRRRCGRRPTTPGSAPREGARWRFAEVSSTYDPEADRRLDRLVTPRRTRGRRARRSRGCRRAPTSVSTSPLPIAATSSFERATGLRRGAGPELDGLAERSRAPRSSRAPGRGRAGAGGGRRRRRTGPRGPAGRRPPRRPIARRTGRFGRAAARASRRAAVGRSPARGRPRVGRGTLAGQGQGVVGHLARREPEAVVGHPAGERIPALDGVEPVHRVARLLEPTPVGEPADVATAFVLDAEDVGVERDHDGRAVEPDSAARPARRTRAPRPRGRWPPVDRLVGVPVRLGHHRPEVLAEQVERRRRHVLAAAGRAAPGLSGRGARRSGGPRTRRTPPRSTAAPRGAPERERSGSYRSSTEACARASELPPLSGCRGLPSILVGRPSWHSTRTGQADARAGAWPRRNRSANPARPLPGASSKAWP